jgi:hypothetical protein
MGAFPTIYTLYSGHVKEAPKEANGEVIFWREEFDLFMDYEDKPPEPDEISVEDEEGTDETLSKVAECLNLGRGRTLIFESAHDFRRKVDARNYDQHTMFPRAHTVLTHMLHDCVLGVYVERW